MRKKFFIQMTVCALFFTFILIFSGKESSVANYSDLNKIVDVINKHNGTVEEWSILARESLDPDLTVADFDQIAESLQGDMLNFSWQKQKNGNQLILAGTFQDTSHPFVETVKITAEMEKNNIRGFILYEIKGSKWNEKISYSVKERQTQVLPKFFHQTPSFFSCIKGEFGDMIDIALLEKSMQMNDDFDGKIVEHLAEKNFVSLTVDSPLFSEKIPTTKGNFDLQISLRNLVNEDKTTFVIGTPILTIEY